MPGLPGRLHVHTPKNLKLEVSALIANCGTKMATRNLEMYANRNPEDSGFLDQIWIGEGKYKNVMKGTYERGGPAADKYLKSGTTFSSECFLDDVRASEAALPYIAGFHDYIRMSFGSAAGVSIKLNMPTVWTQSAGHLRGQKILREPFIEGFEKFNSNSGAADITAVVAQALSHYTYHASDGSELLCDLQGGKVGHYSYVLSDVVMMSKSKKYGGTDLGATGIENWLNVHQCNQFCCAGWKNWSGARRLIEPVFSTTQTLDIATAPATSQELIRVRPSAVKFTHDSIKGQFQDGHTLLETALMIAREEIGKRDIRMITVVRLTDRSLFALDNRRLAVFRLLEMAGRLNTIKVEVVSFAAYADEWNRKCTTKTGGNTIRVRQGDYQIGTTPETTRFPGTHEIRYEKKSLTPQPDDQFAIFLATFTDE